MNKVLVLAVHPDDETLGCAGTILRHKAGGDKIYWLIATAIKEKDGFSKNYVSEREKEIEAVNLAYGFHGVYRLGFSTKRIDHLPKVGLIEKIAGVFNKVKPDIVYLPFQYDAHSDHRIFFESAYCCTKQFRYPFIKKVLIMETISETEFAPSLKETTFIPNYFVDISKFLPKKIEIMGIYKEEIGRHPFPRNARNIKALATFRGATAGCKYAESFMILKEIF